MTDSPKPIIEDELLPDVVDGVVTYFRRETHFNPHPQGYGFLSCVQLLACGRADHPDLSPGNDIKQAVFVTSCPVTPADFMKERISVTRNIRATLDFIDANGIDAYNERVRSKE